MAELMTASRDLTDPEVLKDAEHELRRAELGGGEAALLAWAKRWARPCLAGLRALDDERVGLLDLVEDGDDD